MTYTFRPSELATNIWGNYRQYVKHQHRNKYQFHSTNSWRTFEGSVCSQKMLTPGSENQCPCDSIRDLLILLFGGHDSPLSSGQIFTHHPKKGNPLRQGLSWSSWVVLHIAMIFLVGDPYLDVPGR